MSWQAIAKKDFQDSVRSRTLWMIIGAFLLLIGGLTYLAVDGGADAADAVVGGTFGLGILIFVPLAGLFVSIKSVVRERESGTINLLLSLPHSRGEMIVGKFLGRAGVMSVATFVGFVPAILLILVETDIPFADLLVMLLAVILFGIMFVGIGVGFSALFNTETQASIGGMVIFLLLYLWPAILSEVFDLVDQSIPAFLERFYLFVMLEDMIEALAPDGAGLTAASTVTTEFQGGEIVRPDSVAFYLQNWFVFIILALWIVIPLAIGYLRFNNTDL